MQILLPDGVAANNLLITPGRNFRILATSETLHQALTDSYWCDCLADCCEGKLTGVAMRYTGKSIVLVQFRPFSLTPSGHYYPFSISVPSDFLVPCTPVGSTSSPFSNNRSFTPTSFAPTANPNRMLPYDVASSATFIGEPNDFAGAKESAPHLCVVCGRYKAGLAKRRSGWKCHTCKGVPSIPRLLEEAKRLNALR